MPFVHKVNDHTQRIWEEQQPRSTWTSYFSRLGRLTLGFFLLLACRPLVTASLIGKSLQGRVSPISPPPPPPKVVVSAKASTSNSCSEPQGPPAPPPIPSPVGQALSSQQSQQYIQELSSDNPRDLTWLQELAGAIPSQYAYTVLREEADRQRAFRPLLQPSEEEKVLILLSPQICELYWNHPPGHCFPQGEKRFYELSAMLDYVRKTSQYIHALPSHLQSKAWESEIQKARFAEKIQPPTPTQDRHTAYIKYSAYPQEIRKTLTDIVDPLLPHHADIHEAITDFFAVSFSEEEKKALWEILNNLSKQKSKADAPAKILLFLEAIQRCEALTKNGNILGKMDRMQALCDPLYREYYRGVPLTSQVFSKEIADNIYDIIRLHQPPISMEAYSDILSRINYDPFKNLCKEYPPSQEDIYTRPCCINASKPTSKQSEEKKWI